MSLANVITDASWNSGDLNNCTYVRLDAGLCCFAFKAKVTKIIWSIKEKPLTALQRVF